MNPLQQGLKQEAKEWIRDETEVAIMNPLQQGLKRAKIT